MLGWFMVVGAALSLVGYGAYQATIRRQRRQRRRARRARRLAYQAIWDRIFGRPKMKRLTVRRDR